jgi:hypothetical protein
MATLGDLIRGFETLEIYVQEHKKLLATQCQPQPKSQFQSQSQPTTRKWTYTFPGIDGEPELSTTTDDIKSMITDIRDWYDFTGLEPWTLLENTLKTNIIPVTLYISFKRQEMKTVFDLDSKDWMVKIVYL